MKTMKIKLRKCSQADDEHRLSKRQYSHSFHYPNTICICKRFDKLPEGHRYAIITHEVGHQLGGRNETEKGADKRANQYFGIGIKYVDSSKWGYQLEWVSKREVKDIKEMLKED